MNYKKKRKKERDYIMEVPIVAITDNIQMAPTKVDDHVINVFYYFFIVSSMFLCL